MKVQIEGITNLEDALKAVEYGVDSIGFFADLPTEGCCRINLDETRSIIQKLPPFVSSALVTVEDNAKKIIDMMKYTGATTVLLYDKIHLEQIQQIKEHLPYVKIMYSISVIDESSILEAKQYENYVDGLILDTVNLETGKLGGTGKTHDWNISKQIISESNVPVALAGGLTPDNVKEAIDKVKPWGIDVHTGIENEDHSKNYEKMRLLIQRAKGIVE